MIIGIGSKFNHRVSVFFRERKSFFKQLDTDQFPVNPIWFHAASLGEYEQGKPVIEQMKARFPRFPILLTFYSPSGYLHVGHASFIDFRAYLPLDTPGKAEQFLDLIKPRMAIFIKYDFWINHLRACIHRNIPIYFIACTFQDRQFYFRLGKPLYIPVFKRVNHFFVQDERSRKVLVDHGINQVSVAGDPRIESSLLNAQQNTKKDILDSIMEGKHVTIFGSVHLHDLKKIKKVLAEVQLETNLIVAPHEVNEQELSDFEKYFDKTVRLSQLSKEDYSGETIITDSVGLLKYMYRFANVAFIGGGFKGRLHNTLEPLAFGVPVIFGKHKNNRKFVETTEIINSKAGFEIKNALEFMSRFNKLMDSSYYEMSKKAALNLIQGNVGATSRIVARISQTLE